MTTAKLGGVDLDASAPVPWAFESGVEPTQYVYEFHADRVGVLLQTTDEVTLEISRDDSATLKVSGLSIVAEKPATRPFNRAVLVMDRRWKWDRAFVHGSYNIRRRTGQTRLLDTKLQNSNPTIVPEFNYAPWSLNNGQPWMALDVLKDVFTKLVTKAYGVGAGDAGKYFDLSRVNTSGSLPIENLELVDQGDAAVERLLAYLPGNNVYIDENGVAIVYDTLDLRATASVIPSQERAQVTGNLIAVSQFDRTRPGKIHVLFEREPEVRFDFIEQSVTQTTDNKEPRELQNVVPCPDVKLIIPDGSWGASRTVNYGTWITFDELFAALPIGSFFGQALPFISHDIIQKLWLGPALQLLWVASNTQPDPQWARRINAIFTHYRQTFRIPPKWRDKIRSMRPYRVAILDPTTGTRAPADVFSDYCVRPTLKRLAQTALDPNSLAMGWNVWALDDQGSEDLSQTSLSKAKVSQAVVTILDQDQGIFRVEYMKNLNLLDADIVPSAVDSIPSADPTAQFLTWEYGRLHAKQRLAVVLSVSQAAPNDITRYHEVVVSPDDASNVLGKPIGACSGPEMYIRIGPGSNGELSARFAWLDENSYPQNLEAIFGVAGQKPPQNPTLGDPVNADALLAVARGVSARIYGLLIDRVEGSMTVALDPSIKPTGSLSGVQHVVTTSGVGSTTLSLPPNLDALDMWSLIPDSIRRKLLGLVQPSS